MKIHLMKPQILLLQRIRYSGKIIGEKPAQVALFASNDDSDVVGMDHGSDFHVAEGGGGHSDPHLRLRGLAHHLR